MAANLASGRQALPVALGKLEMAILDVIWDLNEPLGCTNRRIHRELTKRGFKRAFTTITTTTFRMTEKGLLRDVLGTGGHRYWAEYTPDELIHHTISKFVAYLSASWPKRVDERLLLRFQAPTTAPESSL